MRAALSPSNSAIILADVDFPDPGIPTNPTITGRPAGVELRRALMRCAASHSQLRTTGAGANPAARRRKAPADAQIFAVCGH